MRIAVVGAGVAGLTAALALQRDGHDVRVYEQASQLRTGGFGFNLWTNAVSPLHALGVEVPGEPFDRLSFRAGGRHRATMRMPAAGQPHMNVERGALLRALHAPLPPGTVTFDTEITDPHDLYDDGAELVVAADGVGSRLRPGASDPVRTSKPWAVWQAVIADGGDLIEPGGGAIALSPHRFYGLWRMTDGGMCWFVEEPGLPDDVTAETMLARIAEDADPLVRKVAALTPVKAFGRWLARDRRPTSRVVGDRLAVIGDAAHPMLPCIGQGACTSIEDAVALTVALRAADLPAALRRYRRRRVPVTTTRVLTAHLACLLRNPGPIATAIASTPVGVPFAHAAGAWLQMLNRPNL